MTRKQSGQVGASCVALATGLLVGCGGPTDDRVRAAFLRENPDAVITMVAPGEGDSSTVYMHIRHRRAGQAAECEVVWGYQQADREWRLFSRGRRGSAGSVCEGCNWQPCPWDTPPAGPR
jgi:hypothetical protein